MAMLRRPIPAPFSATGRDASYPSLAICATGRAASSRRPCRRRRQHTELLHQQYSPARRRAGGLLM